MRLDVHFVLCDRSVRTYYLMYGTGTSRFVWLRGYESLCTYVANIDLVGDPLQGIYCYASELLTLLPYLRIHRISYLHVASTYLDLRKGPTNLVKSTDSVNNSDPTFERYPIGIPPISAWSKLNAATLKIDIPCRVHQF